MIIIRKDNVSVIIQCIDSLLIHAHQSHMMNAINKSSLGFYFAKKNNGKEEQFAKSMQEGNVLGNDNLNNLKSQSNPSHFNLRHSFSKKG